MNKPNKGNLPKTGKEGVNPNIIEVFNKLPAPERESFIRSINVTASHHSGPLPSAQQIEKYNQIIPDGADRIMKMAEAQSAHRIEVEKVVVRRQLNQSSAGQYIGFIIATIALIISWDLARHGQTAVALGIGTTTVLGLVGTFVIGKIMNNKSVSKESETDD